MQKCVKSVNKRYTFSISYCAKSWSKLVGTTVWYLKATRFTYHHKDHLSQLASPPPKSISTKFSQEAIASSSKTQWQNIKSTWENNKNKPRKQAVANFRLNTGHNCLAAHLHRIKIFSHNCCTICKVKNTTMDKDHLLLCPKLDHTSKLSKLYWDDRRLME